MWTKVRQWIAGTSEKQIADMVHSVVQQSLPAVDGDLAGTTQDMGVAEARGFVRARAHRLVVRNARVVLGSCGVRSSTTLAAVHERALDRTVHLAVRNLLTQTRPPALRVAG